MLFLAPPERLAIDMVARWMEGMGAEVLERLGDEGEWAKPVVLDGTELSNRRKREIALNHLRVKNRAKR